MAKTPSLLPDLTKLPKIKLAFLHQSVSIPGALHTEKTLNQSKFPGIEMFLDADKSIWLKMKGQVAVIPQANVAITIVDPEAC